jgi:hypothetical protein
LSSGTEILLTFTAVIYKSYCQKNVLEDFKYSVVEKFYSRNYTVKFILKDYKDSIMNKHGTTMRLI